MMGRSVLDAARCGLIVAIAMYAPAARAQDPVDTAAILKIKEEGFERSQVMEIASWLADVHGPRLTGSPITKRAGDWALEQFRKWGLANPHYEWWGPFGRGWVNERMLAQVTSPVPFPVIAYPGAWTDGTKGMLRTNVVLGPPILGTAADVAPYRGKLRGKIVLSSPPLNPAPLFSAPAQRYTKAQLDALANPYPVKPAVPPENPPPLAEQSEADTWVDLRQCFIDEGVAAILDPGEGSGGTVWPTGKGSWEENSTMPSCLNCAFGGIPRVTVAAEHYGRIYRILEKGIPVRMDLEVKNTFYTTDLKSFNLIAELPGSDKADEIVILGAHFDSEHAGTGATDNAAGSAVMMEAMRILKASGVRLRRTVRVGLWTGEEQGLKGSREYVKAHFADVTPMKLKPVHAKVSAYYNLDNGTGAIRGIYLQGNAAAGPIFAEWMRLLNSDSISVGHVAPGGTWSTDHESFDDVGIPGFQFIQDSVEYESRTHHSSQDLYERLQAVDMKHNAVVVATFAYLTANRDERLPRKPLPEPRGPRIAGSGGQPICPAK